MNTIKDTEVTETQVTKTKVQKILTEREKSVFSKMRKTQPPIVFNHFRANYAQFLIDLNEQGHNITGDEYLTDYYEMYLMKLEGMKKEQN